MDGLTILILVVIGLVAALLLMPGWKSFVTLFCLYGAGLVFLGVTAPKGGSMVVMIFPPLLLVAWVVLILIGLLKMALLGRRGG